MVRLFRLMLFVMLAAVGVDSNDDLVALRELRPPTIAANVLHSVMAPPPLGPELLSMPIPVATEAPNAADWTPVLTGDVST